MAAGSVNVKLLDAGTSGGASTTRAWTSINTLIPGSTIGVSKIESGGHVQVYVSNLVSPPTAAYTAGDGTFQLGSDLTTDGLVYLADIYQAVAVIKSQAGGSPTETVAWLNGWALA
jgi:hypothetical protein